MPGGDEASDALRRADEALDRMDVDAAVTELSAAIRGLTAGGDARLAALACVRLGQVLATFFANLTASRAWFARAERLVADEPPCVEQGWVAVAAMGCDVDDPEALLARAELALDRARRFGDINLETKALADGGLAQVEAGRVAEGMAMLDEAMALACGPADDSMVAAKSVCSFFTACYCTLDFDRAGSWAELLRRNGLIGPTPGGPLFLSSHCDSVQSALLVELGRWGEAEALLLRAKEEFEATMGPSWHPDIALAELRIRQGRHADAEALLLGKEQSMLAIVPAARVQLERGDLELAVATTRRGLRALGDDNLRAADLLAIQVEALLRAGDVTGAAAACDELEARLDGLDVPTLTARRTATRAAVRRAEGDAAGAVALLEPAIDALDPERWPWLRARLLLELADHRAAAGDPIGAAATAADADAAMAGLDVVIPIASTAGVERVTSDDVAVLAHDGRWWAVTWQGTTSRLRTSKGLHYVAELVSRPGTEQHALDLVDRVEGVGLAGDPDRRRLGDAGELLDSAARTAYRHRIEALRGDIDDALEIGALDRAEALQAELDLLVQQLANAFGLGGRSRTAGAAAERSRLNVTRAIRAAPARLDEALPGAGASLDRRIRTGLYTVYDPAPEDARWIVQS